MLDLPVPGTSSLRSELPLFYSRGVIMAIEIWLPALLGYLVPLGLFLTAWGGMEPQRARRAATVGALALALAALGYFALGFGFHLGGAQVIAERGNLAIDVKGLEGIYSVGEEKQWGLIGVTGFFLSGKDSHTGEPIPLTAEGMALFVNYLPMVAAAVLLVALSAYGRARGWQVTLGGLAVAMFLFPVVACWAWGGGWLANLGAAETVARGHGFVDYAGSGVVYLLGGMAALGALVALGQRLEPGEPGQPEEMPPAHFPLLANLGAMVFGVGLMSWSLSTPFHATGADLNLPRIAVNLVLAGAGAILTTQTYSWLAIGHADALMSARGAVAGFVAAAAGAPFVPPWAALLLGAVVGIALPLGVYVVERGLRLPDATATVAIGIAAGLIGLLAVAIFADGLWGQGWNGVGPDEYQTEATKGVTGFLPAAEFATGDGPGQLIAQLTGMGIISLIAFAAGWITFAVLNLPYKRPWEAREKSVEGSVSG
jgi:Amt family ammonium transporter